MIQTKLNQMMSSLPFKEKKCKACSSTFKAYKSTAQVCSNTCAIQYARTKRMAIEKRESKVRLKQMEENLITIQQLVVKVQKVFNAYIRERDKNLPCISCSKPLVGKFDAGHYHNANNHWNVRFDERNVHGQCVYCNQHLSGNLINYRSGLLNRIGEQQLAELDSISGNTRKFTKSELYMILEYYRNKNK